MCFSSTEQTEEINQKNRELICLNNTLNNVLNNISDGVVTVDSTGNFEILHSLFIQGGDKILEEIKSKFKGQLRHPHQTRESAGESGVHHAAPVDTGHFLLQKQCGSGGRLCRSSADSAWRGKDHNPDSGLRLAGRPSRQTDKSPLTVRGHG